MNALSLPWISVTLTLLYFNAQAATYTLTTLADGNGAISRNPIASSYPQGSTVTLTAVPDANWVFTSWSGDVSAAANPVNVVMDGNKVVTAHFTAIPSYALTVNVSGHGTVAPTGGSYISNTVIQITATPSNGWIFHRWSGDGSGAANPLSLAMNGPKTVQAVFGQPPRITLQPESIVAQPGQMVLLNSVATGSEPLDFQWLFGGSALNGANAASLTITNVQIANAGNYRLVVTNLFGRATSEVAMVTVSCDGTNVLTTCTETALRTAIAAGGHVRVCCNDTITLTSPVDVAKDTVLDASGQNFGISGNNAVRLFNVAAGTTLVVSNALLANGRSIGTNNPNGTGKQAAGGAILNLGTLKLYSCVLSNNAAVGGSGISGGNASGGAIHSTGGTVLLDRALVLSNFVHGGVTTGGNGTSGVTRGGAIYSENSTIVVVESTLTQNLCTTPNNPSSPARGGALYQASGAAVFTNSIISSNRVDGEAGTYGGASTRIPGSAEGAGIFALTGDVTLDRAVLIRNSAIGGNAARSDAGIAKGGGIYAAGNTLILRSTLTENTATGGNHGTGGALGQGAGVWNGGSATIVDTTFHGNAASGGIGGSWGTPLGWSGSPATAGGLFNEGLLALTNTTIHANSAWGGRGASGGTPAGGAHGGGIHNVGSVQALNVTIASNSIGTGFGYTSFVAGANIAISSGSFTLRNSLIAYPGTNANVWGTIIDAGYNISSDGSAGFGGGTSFNFTDPKLLPIANNGGPTLTMALAEDSPAIDWAPATGAPATDQRGEPRPIGTGVDVGAFEAGTQQPRLCGTLNGSMFKLSFTIIAGPRYELQRSSDLASWETVETISTSGPVTRSFPRTASREFYRLRSISP